MLQVGKSTPFHSILDREAEGSGVWEGRKDREERRLWGEVCFKLSTKHRVAHKNPQRCEEAKA